MSKVFQAFFSGIFFTFILDFFVILGIKLNYIDFHKIDVYYNILFADHQNIYLFGISTVVLGFLVTYLDNYKISISVIGGLSVLALLTLIPQVGHKVGEMMLMQKNVTLQDKRHTYIGDIYYDGRKKISFYDIELKRIITLNKKDLK